MREGRESFADLMYVTQKSAKRSFAGFCRPSSRLFQLDSKAVSTHPQWSPSSGPSFPCLSHCPAATIISEQTHHGI